MKIFNSQTYLKDLNAIFDSKHSFFFGKTFLITGGLGLIGSAIVDYLLFLNVYKNADIKITIADINKERYYETYSSYKTIAFVHYDASKDIDFSLNFDFIIHCAGIASPNLYVSHPVETIFSHIIGLQNILKKIDTNTTLLYVSSSEIYGKRSNEQSNETSYGVLDIDNIRSSYAISKQMCEMMCKAFFSEYKNKILVVRPGHVFGPTSSPTDSRVSSSFCFDAANGNKLVLKSDGSQIRSYCYSIDCVAAILYLLVRGSYGESYNIGSKEKITIAEMAQIISTYSNVELIRLCPTNQDKKEFNPMDDSSLNSKKLELLGFKYHFSAKEGFTHTIEILKEALEK